MNKIIVVRVFDSVCANVVSWPTE